MASFTRVRKISRGLPAVLAAAFLLLTASTAAAAPSAGVVGLWTVDEGGGARIVDHSPYGNDGVLSGDVTWVPGKNGAALSFNGGPGRVMVTDDPSLEPPVAVTVSAWVKHSGSPGAFRYIVAKGENGCIAASYGLYTGPSGGLRFYVSHNRGTVYARSADGGARVWDGAWHFVVGEFDGRVIRLFVDGREVGSSTLYPGALEYLLADSNELFIGDYPGCVAHQFAGDIDQVEIWNRALGPSEVAALAADADSPAAPPPNPNIPPGSSSQPGRRSVGHRPVIRGLTVAPASISLRRARTVTRTTQRTAMTITYTDSIAARSTLTILRAKPGVRHGKRCVKPGKQRAARRAQRCTRYVTVLSFPHDDRQGRNRSALPGLTPSALGPRGFVLSVGRYHLEVTPRAHGLRGATVGVAFRLLS